MIKHVLSPTASAICGFTVAGSRVRRIASDQGIDMWSRAKEQARKSARAWKATVLVLASDSAGRKWTVLEVVG